MAALDDHLAVRPRLGGPALGRRAFLTAGAACLAAGPAVAASGDASTMSAGIGQAVSAVDAASLTPEVVDRVRLCLVDNLGTLAFTGRAARHDHFLHRLAARGGRPEASVVGTRLRTPWEDAAAAAAYLIHYSETDDSDFRAELRASPTVMGPALALAQWPGVTGADLTAAIAAGYSVLGGLAAPVGPTQDDGLMSAGVWGPSASAAVAARMMRLDPRQTANALGLAAGAAGGLFQYFYDQTEEKRLVVARAARAGVESALLAAQGEVGPARVYEGQAGLYRVLGALTGSKPDVSGVVAAVRRMDGPLYIYPKFFAASSSITPSLEALAPAVAAGLSAGEVERVALRGDPARYGVVASKLDHFETPGTVIGAKINYAFMMAFMLVNGAADAATVAAARLDDARVIALARKFAFEPAPGDPGHVVLHLRSGQSRVLPIPNQRPGSVAPAALELRAMKFDRLAGSSLGAARAAALRRVAGGGPEATSGRRWIGELQALLLPGLPRT